jgi:hypothetical protein
MLQAGLVPVYVVNVVWLCLFGCLCLRVCVCVCVCVCMCQCVRVLVRTCARACVSACNYMRVYMHVCSHAIFEYLLTCSSSALISSRSVRTVASSVCDLE